MLFFESRVARPRGAAGRGLTCTLARLARRPAAAAWPLRWWCWPPSCCRWRCSRLAGAARSGSAGFELVLCWHSAMPSLLAALAAVSRRFAGAAATDGRFGRVLERLTTLGFGVPGIVMGTALVYLGLRLPFMYQTTALLVLAYVLRFLPLAVGAVRDQPAGWSATLPGARARSARRRAAARCSGGSRCR
ncbi:MAG: hypothetical protein U5R48_01335 [Gammaproteobacteria bacterium]|nr:hypothetical protein [Gammaproteobacteria bacterium]